MSQIFFSTRKEILHLQVPMKCSDYLLNTHQLHTKPFHFTNSFYAGKDAIKGVFIWSGTPRSSGVGFFCFHALRDTKQKKPTPLDRGPPLHVNRVLFQSSLSNSDLFTCEITCYVLM